MKFKVGSWYFIEFLDHAVGIEKPCIIHAAGLVREDGKEGVHFTSWCVQSTDLSVVSDNLESFCVVKSSIKKRKLIKPF